MSFFNRKNQNHSKRGVRSIVPPEQHSKEQIEKALCATSDYILKPNSYGSYDVSFTPKYIKSLQETMLRIFRLVYYTTENDLSIIRPLYNRYFATQMKFNDLEYTVKDDDHCYCDGIWGPRTRQHVDILIEIILNNLQIKNKISRSSVTKLCPWTTSTSFRFMVSLSYSYDVLMELEIILNEEIITNGWCRHAEMFIMDKIKWDAVTSSKGATGSILYKENPLHKPAVHNNNDRLTVIDGNVPNTIYEENNRVLTTNNTDIKTSNIDSKPTEKRDSKVVPPSHIFLIKEVDSKLILSINGHDIEIQNPEEISLANIIQLDKILSKQNPVIG